MRIIDLSDGLDFKQVDGLLADSEDEDLQVEQTVLDIIADVRRRGDAALCDYTLKFDDCELTPATIRVRPPEIRERAAGADDELVGILKQATKNVREFHEQQRAESWEYYAGDGTRLGVRINPMD